MPQVWRLVAALGLVWDVTRVFTGKVVSAKSLFTLGEHC
jgi:hypothetical protein